EFCAYQMPERVNMKIAQAHSDDNGTRAHQRFGYPSGRRPPEGSTLDEAIGWNAREKILCDIDGVPLIETATMDDLSRASAARIPRGLSPHPRVGKRRRPNPLRHLPRPAPYPNEKGMMPDALVKWMERSLADYIATAHPWYGQQSAITLLGLLTEAAFLVATI